VIRDRKGTPVIRELLGLLDEMDPLDLAEILVRAASRDQLDLLAQLAHGVTVGAAVRQAMLVMQDQPDMLGRPARPARPARQGSHRP
jgi:hypothetical protein